MNGKRIEVRVPAALAAPAAAKAATAKKPTRRSKSGAAAKAPSTNALTSPMQGTIVKVNVEEGQSVAEGDTIAVIEAMKMEQPLNAHRGGLVKALAVEAGSTVTAGQVLCEIVDE